MDRFYATLESDNTKEEEALRQAEIALIQENFSITGLSRGDGSIAVRDIRTGLPPQVSTRLSHPYYWSPFILIGNGL